MHIYIKRGDRDTHDRTWDYNLKRTHDEDMSNFILMSKTAVFCHQYSNSLNTGYSY